MVSHLSSSVPRVRSFPDNAALIAKFIAASRTTACTPAWTVQPVLRGQPAAGPDPASYAGNYALGRQRQQRGELEAAASAFEQAIALAPHERDARNALAVLYAGRGQLAQAHGMLARLNADFPQQPSILSNLGYVDYLRGDHADAVAALRQALALDAAQPHVRANLALAERALRDSGAADPAAPATAPPAPPSPPSQPASATSRAVAATILPAASPLELVQLAPHEFRLRLRAGAPAAETPLAAASMPAAATIAPSMQWARRCRSTSRTESTVSPPISWLIGTWMMPSMSYSTGSSVVISLSVMTFSSLRAE